MVKFTNEQQADVDGIKGQLRSSTLLSRERRMKRKRGVVLLLLHSRMLWVTLSSHCIKSHIWDVIIYKFVVIKADFLKIDFCQGDFLIKL